MDYLINTSGITDIKNYPYTARFAGCQKDKIVDPTPKFASKQILAQTAQAHISALSNATVGFVISVNRALFNYKSGVFKDPTCATRSMGLHAIIGVGFKTDGAEPYYKLKNSWKKSWGDKGYFKLALMPNDGQICKYYMSTTQIKFK